MSTFTLISGLLTTLVVFAVYFYVRYSLVQAFPHDQPGRLSYTLPDTLPDTTNVRQWSVAEHANWRAKQHTRTLDGLALLHAELTGTDYALDQARGGTPIVLTRLTLEDAHSKRERLNAQHEQELRRNRDRTPSRSKNPANPNYQALLAEDRALYRAQAQAAGRTVRPYTRAAATAAQPLPSTTLSPLPLPAPAARQYGQAALA